LDIGNAAGGLKDPAKEVLLILQYLGKPGKIHQVHMRNIRAGLHNFYEVFPDEDNVDFLEVVRILRDTQFSGSICPDHLPSHPDDPVAFRRSRSPTGISRVVNSEV
jgi:mannonate dehydratase